MKIVYTITGTKLYKIKYIDEFFFVVLLSTLVFCSCQSTDTTGYSSSPSTFTDTTAPGNDATSFTPSTSLVDQTGITEDSTDKVDSTQSGITASEQSSSSTTLFTISQTSEGPSSSTTNGIRSFLVNSIIDFFLYIFRCKHQLYNASPN